MNRDDRLKSLVDTAKTVATRDAEKTDAAYHEPGWQRLERARQNRRPRWRLFFLAPALVATAVLLIVRFQDQKRLGGDLAVDVRGGDLGPGGRIDVRSPLGATLIFSDGAQIDVDPDSDVRLLNRTRRQPLIRLESGRLTVRVPEFRLAPFAIQAGQSRIESSGGDFDIVLAPKKDGGLVAVRNGQALVMGTASPQIVSTGERRSWGASSPAIAPTPHRFAVVAAPSRHAAPYVDPVHLGRALTLDAAATARDLLPFLGWQATLPATRLRDALGVTLGDQVIDERHAQWLAHAGITHATAEFGWNHLDPSDLGRFGPGFTEQRRILLRRLRQVGIRPTILLNAWGGPPSRSTNLNLSRPAARGDRQINLTPGSVPAVQTGNTRLGEGTEAFITSISADGTALLSRPLPIDLPAGPHNASTFIYPPFRRPTLANGDPDALFTETLEGWIRYVRAATTLARETLRDDEFDIEIWNIATGARDLFDVERYFDPAPLDLGPGGPEAATLAMLTSAAAYIRNPENQLSHVRIANGFSNRRWHETVASQPPGIDALGRHIVLRADSFFPEQALFALGPDRLWRDLASTFVIAPSGNARLRDAEGPTVWVNSLALGLSRRQAALGLSPADVWHQKARFALRAIAAYVGKGAGRVTFYHHDSAESLVDPSQPDGGPVVGALHRFMTAMGPQGVISHPRTVALAAVTAPPDAPSATFTFLPFQLAEDIVAIPVYLLTRTPLAQPVPGLKGSARFDAAPARFRVRLTGIPALAEATLFDPMIPGAAIVLSPVRQEGDEIVLDLDVSDTPRILRLSGK